MSEILFSAKNICKAYAQGTSELQILKNISLDIYRGETLSIVGASGAGKSTFLHILGTLDRPNEGEIFYEGQDILTYPDEELAKFRNTKMGFVFQFHHLLGEFTALENVMIPGRIFGQSVAEASSQAKAILDRVGLIERIHHYPNQLSGGELQRVAIARALVMNPQILFADEPTGNLDSKNSGVVQNLFFEMQKQTGLTLVCVTHDAQFAGKFQRNLRMSDGQWMKAN